VPKCPGPPEELARSSQLRSAVLPSLCPRGLVRRRDGNRGSKKVTVENRLSGGALNAALANELGKLIADFTGRGAQRSRAFVHQDVVVCVLEETATSAEQNLALGGRSDLVRLQRDAATPHATAADSRRRAAHAPHRTDVLEWERRSRSIGHRGVRARARISASLSSSAGCALRCPGHPPAR
jgi:Na+-translocating membrane potential-generating system (MpsC)